jgi:hypothetical protein
MEALCPQLAEQANEHRRLPRIDDGYLAQSEMRTLIDIALEHDFTLIAYEADPRRRPVEFERLSIEETNWREDQQARNLANALADLPRGAPLLVWCGNGHLVKRAIDDWRSMGSRIEELTGVEPFAIDQVPSVQFEPDHPAIAAAWVEAFRTMLDDLGGTAGFLAEEAPPDWPQPHLVDAYLISTHNEMT